MEGLGMILTSQQLNTIENCLPDYASIQSYSGRVMYGKSCLGIRLDTVDSLQFVAEFIHSLTQEDDSLAGALIDESLRWDDLGLGTIVYFPSVQFPESSHSRTYEQD
jgi:hypothetical protein